MTGPASRKLSRQLRLGRLTRERAKSSRSAAGSTLPRASAFARCWRREHDMVVINSCAVTAEAVRQTRQAIRRARRARPDARLLVTGCAAEIERDALAAMPEVDGLVANAAKLDPRAWNVPPRDPCRCRSATPAASSRCRTAATMPAPSASSRRAAGRAARCRSPQVLREVERHLARGAGEVVLTGVDLTSWGHDLPGAPRLGALVARDPRRVPRACPPAPVLARRDRDRCRAVRAARRRAAGDAARAPVAAARPRPDPQADEAPPFARRCGRRWSSGCARAGPDIAIGADLIAGFPTENEAHARAPTSSIVARARRRPRPCLSLFAAPRHARRADAAGRSAQRSGAAPRELRERSRATRGATGSQASSVGTLHGARRSATAPATRENFARVAAARRHRARRDRDRSLPTAHRAKACCA